MIYHQIPRDPAKARQSMQRFLSENASIVSTAASGWRRPFPPRSLVLTPGSLEVLLTWISPNDNSILGYNVYQDNENNQVLIIANPTTGQAKMKVPAGVQTAFYVSSFNGTKESVKVGIVGAAFSDLYVVTGTSGGTAGKSATIPPGYQYKVPIFR